jgi:hypothetical protein
MPGKKVKRDALAKSIGLLGVLSRMTVLACPAPLAHLWSGKAAFCAEGFRLSRFCGVEVVCCSHACHLLHLYLLGDL